MKTDAQLDQPDALRLAAACKMGRILGGHDSGVPRWPLPELPNREELTLEGIKLQAVRRALEKHQGNVGRAARELNIERNTLYQIVNRNGLKRMPKAPENIVRLAQVAAVVVMLLVTGCVTNEKAESGKQKAEMREVLLPPVPGAARSSQIEGGESQAAGAAIGPPAPRKLTLIWNKNDPDPDTVTEFWATEDFTNWYFYAESKEPGLEITADQPRMFFDARNRLYNQYSEWASGR